MPGQRRIRVLRVIARMNVGGPALQVSGLMDGLDADRFDHRLLTGFVDEGEGDYLELRAPHVPATRVDGLGRSVDALGDLRALRRLAEEVRAFRPDVVHTHTAKAGVLGRLAARAVRPRPRLVHTFHGHLLHGYFSPTVTRAVTGVEQTLARGTDRLVAVGERVRDELLAAGVGRPEQYVVVPPGIALPAAPPREVARERLGLPADALVVTFVARLTTIKRPERFLEVARLLSGRHPEAVFVVVGEGELLGDLRRQAAALGGRVRFLGWRSDVEVVYAATDLVVLTSDNEGTPVSLIEAALCGVPAVATDVGSVREVVPPGAGGLLTPPDVPALAVAVGRLLGDAGERARLAAGARAHAEARYSRARLVRDTERLYDDLVGASRSRRGSGAG